MEIHKPKPIHSWRELATEIGVIVIGILIALGLEQAIESYRSHQQATVAETALDEQLRSALQFAEAVARMGDCSSRQLAALAEAVGKGDQQKVKDGLDRAVLPPPFGWPDDAWQSVLASDVSDHIDQHRRAGYTILFGFVREARAKQERYVDSYGRLRAMATTGLSSSPEAAAAEVSELAETTAAVRDYIFVAKGMPTMARNRMPEILRPMKSRYEFAPSGREEMKCEEAAAALSPAREN